MVPNKQFEPDLYRKYDGPAKKALAEHLRCMGFVVELIKENYGVDLKAFKKKKGSNIYTNHTYLHEVEVSRNWKGDEPPPNFWKEFRIPYRKHKLLIGLPSRSSLKFWILNVIYTAAIYIDSKKLLERSYELRRVRIAPNFYGPDKFYIFDKKEFNYTKLRKEII